MSEEQNSFKELQELQEEEYKDNLNKVKQSVDSNVNSIGSLSNIVDLYFSKVLSYLVSMTGGSDKDDNNT